MIKSAEMNKKLLEIRQFKSSHHRFSDKVTLASSADEDVFLAEM